MSIFYLDINKDSEERYDEGKFFNWIDDGYDTLTSKFLNDLKKIKTAGQIKISYEENRPELLSYDLYGDNQYWWILLYYNDLTSPDELVNGMTIYYPNLKDLEIFYFNLKKKSLTEV